MQPEAAPLEDVDARAKPGQGGFDRFADVPAWLNAALEAEPDSRGLTPAI
jgi:hypothetical protein